MKSNSLRYVATATIAACCAISGIAESLSPEQALKYLSSKSTRIQLLNNDISVQQLNDQAEASAEYVPELDYTQTFGKAGSKIDAGISMGFDWPSLYGKRKDYAVSRNAVYEYTADAEQIAIVSEGLRLITDGTYANARLVDLRKSLEVLERAQQLIKTGYDHGQLTIIDVRKAELEVVSARIRVAEAEAELAEVRRQLSELAGVDSFDVDMSNYMAIPQINLDACLAGIDRMPNVLAARAKANSQRTLVDVEKARRKPGFSLGYVFQREINENFNGFSFGMTLPIRSKLYEQTAIAQAESYDTEAETLVKTQTVTVKQLYANLTSLRTKIDALSAVALGSNYIELCEKAWRGGQINVLTYLQEVGYYIDTRMSVLDLEHQYRLTQAELLPYATYAK